MIQYHEYEGPRALYEKLLRESKQLDGNLNGDNMFNFITTAYHLKEWIKKSPLGSSEIFNRLLRRLKEDKYVQLCKAVACAQKHFTLIEDRIQQKTIVKIDEEELDPIVFKNSISDLYKFYFEVK